MNFIYCARPIETAGFSKAPQVAGQLTGRRGGCDAESRSRVVFLWFKGEEASCLKAATRRSSALGEMFVLVPLEFSLSSPGQRLQIHRKIRSYDPLDKNGRKIESRYDIDFIK